MTILFYFFQSRPTCPLPVLVSSVLLPTTVYSCEKPLNATLSTALAGTIPKVTFLASSFTIISKTSKIVVCVLKCFD